MSATGRRLIVIHRWAGRPDAVFYPWLRREIRRSMRDAFDEVRIPLMPEPDAPVIERWVEAIGEVVGRPTSSLARTVLLGHSVGCQAILRWLATLPAGHRIAGALLVAGWWSVDAPWDTIRPWIDAPFDVARARQAIGRARVLLSDDDPFTRDAAATAALFRERLGAEPTIVKGAGHFNRSEEPEVLAALAKLAGA
jgi:predicted alpha/beta hydrolase family esterase